VAQNFGSDLILVIRMANNSNCRWDVAFLSAQTNRKSLLLHFADTKLPTRGKVYLLGLHRIKGRHPFCHVFKLEIETNTSEFFTESFNLNWIQVFPLMLSKSLLHVKHFNLSQQTHFPPLPHFDIVFFLEIGSMSPKRTCRKIVPPPHTFCQYPAWRPRVSRLSEKVIPYPPVCGD